MTTLLARRHAEAVLVRPQSCPPAVGLPPVPASHASVGLCNSAHAHYMCAVSMSPVGPVCRRR